jgi:hypothetical protein
MADRQPKSIDAPSSERPSRAGRFGMVALRLALDIVVLDAAYETWMSPSPIRTAVAGAVVVYVALTLWVLTQGGRVGGRGWITDPVAPVALLLLMMVGATWTVDGAARGLVVARQPTPVVLAGATLLLTLLATWRLAGPPGVRAWWAKSVVLAAGVYAAVSLVLAIRARTPYVAMLAGESFWQRFPVPLRGAAVGAFVLVPLGAVREFGMSMVKLTFRGLLRWLVLFALGAWVAFNAANL